MNKYILLLSFIINYQIHAQSTVIKSIDRFDTDKNSWSFKTSDNWDCSIQNGKLYMKINDKYDYIWLYADGINNLSNKAYTEIAYDFAIENNTSDDFGTGMVFMNNLNSKVFEQVRLVLAKDYSFFIKDSKYHPDYNFNFGVSKSPIFKDINSVRIIFDNRETADNTSHIMVYINDVLIINSEWKISNFNKVGFIVYGKNKISYDNLIIKQTEEENYVEDAFDFLSINGKVVIDHNGIKDSELMEYIPAEIIDTKNIISTKELIQKLYNNKNCTSIKTKKVDFNGKKRDLFSFNYGNSIIEFFTDTDKPNPIFINFLEKDELDKFFKIYSDYNSYRFEENRAQWPSHPWFSILKDYDSYKATIWRGM